MSTRRYTGGARCGLLHLATPQRRPHEIETAVAETSVAEKTHTKLRRPWLRRLWLRKPTRNRDGRG